MIVFICLGIPFKEQKITSDQKCAWSTWKWSGLAVEAGLAMVESPAAHSCHKKHTFPQRCCKSHV